jgi:hypothetical protein
MMVESTVLSRREKAWFDLVSGRIVEMRWLFEL